MESNKKVLTKNDITKLGIRSMFLQASFNFERMQASGWLFAILPFLKKIHKDDKKALSASMKDNLEFINTNPTMSGFLMGLLISLEENGESRDTIKGLKIALFGPIAGIGDAIFWFTLLPIVAGVSSSFAMQGNIIGPIIFFLTYLTIYILRIPLTHLGYNLGVKGVEKIKDDSQKIGKTATIMGVTVIGGLVASYVKINVIAEIPITETTVISLQKDFFDKILPNILPLGYTFLMYYLLKIKNFSAVKLIFITFVGAIILSYFKVL